MSDEESIVRYLQNICLRQTAATYHRKKQVVHHFLNYCSKGKIEFSSANQQDIESYLNKLTCSTVTKKMICGVLKEVYNAIAGINPLQSIHFRRQEQRIVHLPPQPRLQRAIASVHDPRNRLLIELAYGSGLRRAELWGLSIEDIDTDGKTIYVHGKGGATRLVPMTNQSIILLKEYLRGRSSTRGPLFVSRHGGRLGIVRIEQIFKRETGFHPHLFRHACASHMLANGCSLRILQELLGHKNLTTTCRYTHIEKQALKEVIERFHPRSSKRG